MSDHPTYASSPCMAADLDPFYVDPKHATSKATPDVGHPRTSEREDVDQQCDDPFDLRTTHSGVFDRKAIL